MAAPRTTHLAVALLASLLAASATHADPPSRAQRGCIAALNASGARVAGAVTKDVLACVADALAGRLPAGMTATACFTADRRGAVAAAKARTAGAAARRCRTAPPFGPATADAVNAAFGDLLRLPAIFGADVDAALAAGRGDRGVGLCQTCVVRGMARVAAARVKEFDACVTAGLRRGTIQSAAGLGACLDADAKHRVARAIARAGRSVRKKCATTSIPTALPGECAASGADAVFDCVTGRLQCGVCLAVDAADGVGRLCHTYADGVATVFCGTRPATTQSVARQWDEELLGAIRRDTPRPTVHARNLFHTSVAMWDAWAAYDPTAKGYLVREKRTASDVEHDRAIAISFAAYRLLTERFPKSPGAAASQASFDQRFENLGFDKSFTDTAGDSPAAFGNRVAAAVIAHGQADGSNEANDYADDSGYVSVNDPLIVKQPGTTMVDPNHWQPLALDQIISQNGIVQPGKVQIYVGPHWGSVTPFALNLSHPDVTPPPPPLLGGAGDDLFKTRIVESITLSSELDPSRPDTKDISPAHHGNHPLGADDDGTSGYAANPVTGQPYAPNVVKLGDWGRVLAEFWADGPNSETPPGHWNVIANGVADDPRTVKKIGGAGPVVGALEWDVKVYLAVNGAVHDAAIACWGAKRVWDYARPISMVRYMGGRGQSSDSSGAAYDPEGLPLVPGLIEVITAQTTAPGGRHAALAGHEGEIAVLAWPGGPADPKTQVSGARWIRAVEWVPYQKATFVTPAFPGYTSGHSTFSRSAAEVLTRITGSPWFPGGLGEFVARQGTYLTFEQGPTTDVVLQWASYFDAADEAGLSRRWGGIHVVGDDYAGRRAGHTIGNDAYDLAATYFDGTAP